jgi:hypothetical protein
MNTEIHTKASTTITFPGSSLLIGVVGINLQIKRSPKVIHKAHNSLG